MPIDVCNGEANGIAKCKGRGRWPHSGHYSSLEKCLGEEWLCLVAHKGLKLSAQDLLAVPGNGVEELIFNKKTCFLPSKLVSMYIFHFPMKIQELIILPGFLKKSHKCK